MEHEKSISCNRTRDRSVCPFCTEAVVPHTEQGSFECFHCGNFSVRVEACYCGLRPKEAPTLSLCGGRANIRFVPPPREEQRVPENISPRKFSHMEQATENKNSVGHEEPSRTRIVPSATEDTQYTRTREDVLPSLRKNMRPPVVEYIRPPARDHKLTEEAPLPSSLDEGVVGSLKERLMKPLIVAQEERLLSLYSKQKEELNDALRERECMPYLLVKTHIRELERALEKNEEENDDFVLSLTEFYNKMTEYEKGQSASKSDVKSFLCKH